MPDSPDSARCRDASAPGLGRYAVVRNLERNAAFLGGAYEVVWTGSPSQADPASQEVVAVSRDTCAAEWARMAAIRDELLSAWAVMTA